MAEYRVVHMTFWNDTKIQDDLSPEDKYFYLYLLTNPYTNLCGCYELSLNKAAIELGYNKETVIKLINRFKDDYKLICYSEDTKELLIINWAKNNWSASPKYITALEKSINTVKEAKFAAFLTQNLNYFKSTKEFKDFTSVLYDKTPVEALPIASDSDSTSSNPESLISKDFEIELTEEELFEKEKNKKDPKTLMKWTNTWVVNDEIKDLLIKWISVMITNRKFVTLKAYRDKLDLLYSDCENNHELIKQAITNSIEGGWMAFYRPKMSYVRVNTAQNKVSAKRVDESKLDLSTEVF